LMLSGHTNMRTSDSTRTLQLLQGPDVGSSEAHSEMYINQSKDELFLQRLHNCETEEGTAIAIAKENHIGTADASRRIPQFRRKICEIYLKSMACACCGNY